MYVNIKKIVKLASDLKRMSEELYEEINKIECKEITCGKAYIWSDKHRATAKRRSMDITNASVEIRKALYDEEKI